MRSWRQRRATRKAQTASRRKRCDADSQARSHSGSDSGGDEATEDGERCEFVMPADESGAAAAAKIAGADAAGAATESSANSRPRATSVL